MFFFSLRCCFQDFNVCSVQKEIYNFIASKKRCLAIIMKFKYFFQIKKEFLQFFKKNVKNQLHRTLIIGKRLNFFSQS